MSRPDLMTRVDGLYESLGEIGAAGGEVSKSTAAIFNAIVALAKEQFPDDPIIQVLAPTTESVIGRPIESAGDLRASLKQIQSALRQL